MTSTKKAAGKATKNEFGGIDYRGAAGLARTVVEDGVTTVYFFERHGRGDLMGWSVTFSDRAPAALKSAAIAEARRLADGNAK